MTHAVKLDLICRNVGSVGWSVTRRGRSQCIPLSSVASIISDGKTFHTCILIPVLSGFKIACTTVTQAKTDPQKDEGKKCQLIKLIDFYFIIQLSKILLLWLSRKGTVQDWLFNGFNLHSHRSGQK